MCALSALSALIVLLLSFQRGGSVRLKRLMRHKPPLFELKGDGTNGFQVTHDGRPTRRGRCPQFVVPSCQRPIHGKRTPGRTPAHRAICAHSSASSLGVGIQSGKRGQSVLFNDEQLTMAEK
jgi:hypothetical protein